MVMKKLYKSLFVLCMAFPFVSCEKDLPVYDYEECGLMFEYQYARDSTYSYSFAFGPSDVTVDTVELDVALLGNVVDYDRGGVLPSNGKSCLRSCAEGLFLRAAPSD